MQGDYQISKERITAEFRYRRSSDPTYRRTSDGHFSQWGCELVAAKVGDLSGSQTRGRYS